MVWIVVFGYFSVFIFFYLIYFIIVFGVGAVGGVVLGVVFYIGWDFCVFCR